MTLNLLRLQLVSEVLEIHTNDPVVLIAGEPAICICVENDGTITKIKEILNAPLDSLVGTLRTPSVD